MDGAPGATLDAFFFFNDTATTEIYALSLHDALPIFKGGTSVRNGKLVIGTDHTTGIVDVEGAEGATLDNVSVTAIAADDTIDDAQSSASTLSLKNGTSIAGGSLVIGAAGFIGTVDVE